MTEFSMQPEHHLVNKSLLKTVSFDKNRFNNNFKFNKQFDSTHMSQNVANPLDYLNKLVSIKENKSSLKLFKLVSARLRVLEMFTWL